MGFGVWGLGFRVWGLGFGVWGFGVWGLGFRVCRVYRVFRVCVCGVDKVCRVDGLYRSSLGFGVQGCVSAVVALAG